jgi:hypothetical protein
LGIGLAQCGTLWPLCGIPRTPAWARFVNGPRDISANIKLKLPEFWRGQPGVAVGLNDISGGASFFKSRYGVVSDQWGPVRWSAGYAFGSPSGGNTANGYAFDGAFGGVEWLVGQTGLSLLAEYDGQQKHVGARYTSPAIPWLADAQVVATLQRSSGARDVAGRDMDRTSAAVSVVIPLETLAQKPTTFKPEKTLASLDARPGAAGVPGMTPTAEDRQDALQKALVATGLERVRVGTQGSNLVVEYENNRYGQNEADAIGLVLGLAVEHTRRPACAACPPSRSRPGSACMKPRWTWPSTAPSCAMATRPRPVAAWRWTGCRPIAPMR